MLNGRFLLDDSVVLSYSTGVRLELWCAHASHSVNEAIKLQAQQSNVLHAKVPIGVVMDHSPNAIFTI